MLLYNLCAHICSCFSLWIYVIFTVVNYCYSCCAWHIIHLTFENNEINWKKEKKRKKEARLTLKSCTNGWDSLMKMDRVLFIWIQMDLVAIATRMDGNLRTNYEDNNCNKWKFDDKTWPFLQNTAKWQQLYQLKLIKIKPFKSHLKRKKLKT